MPTILDKFGIQLDPNFEKLDGVSLLPLLKNESMEELISYTETANPLKESEPPKKPNTKCVRTSKWKLIFNEYDNSKELYNLENDPNELLNLIDNDLKIKEFLWDELKKINSKS
jgi:arylsulfatase A-like enzyme